MPRLTISAFSNIRTGSGESGKIGGLGKDLPFYLDLFEFRIRHVVNPEVGGWMGKKSEREEVLRGPWANACVLQPESSWSPEAITTVTRY